MQPGVDLAACVVQEPIVSSRAVTHAVAEQFGPLCSGFSDLSRKSQIPRVLEADPHINIIKMSM